MTKHLPLQGLACSVSFQFSLPGISHQSPESSSSGSALQSSPFYECGAEICEWRGSMTKHEIMKTYVEEKVMELVGSL